MTQDPRKFNQARAAERMPHLARLADSEDFQWFIAESTQKEMDALEPMIHQEYLNGDREKFMTERDRAVIRWNTLLAIRRWVDLETQSCRETLAQPEEKQ